jgi:hypothetical protein
MLTLGVLMGAVDIVASNNDHWQLETLLVRMNQHFCRGLAGCVWIGGGQNASFQQIIFVIFDFSVDLIGGDMDELLYSNLLRTLQENVCPVNIGVGESVRVTKTQIDVGLRREVEDGIDIVSLKAVHNLRRIGNVAMVECEVALVVQDSGVVQRSTVVKFVEGYDIIRVRVRQGQVSHKPASTRYTS